MGNRTVTKEELVKLGCLNPEDYKNNRIMNLKFKCKTCGDVVETSFATINRYGSISCKKCHKKNAQVKAFLKIKPELIEAGCLNVDDYVNSKTKNLKFKCSDCGKVIVTSWGNRKSGRYRCKECGIVKANETKKLKAILPEVINPDDYCGCDVTNLQFVCSNPECNNTYTASRTSYLYTHRRLCKGCLHKYHPSIVKSNKELKEVGCLNVDDFVDSETSNLKFRCTNCGNIYTTNKYSYFNGHSRLCSKCSGNFSKPEEELAEYIKSIYSGKIIRNYKDKAKGISELDIYLPELNYAIEFNGTIWHSEKYQKNINYHKNKTDACKNIGINLWHIWEDDWKYKKPLIKAMLRSRITKDNKKIFARKCEVREVTDNKLIKEFMNTNHLQGFVGSKVKYGLYFNDELYSLMTFALSKGTWTLNRFCTKIGYTVVGGASKLLKHFQKEHVGVDVYSFSDNTYSDGGLYETLGFIKVGNVRVDYKYLYKGRLEHKFGFRHKYLDNKLKTYDSTLSEHENCFRNGVYRVYDSGKIKWVLRSEK